MHLTFLGTSAGAPTLSRNVTAQALTFDDGRIWLLDCGEATQHQLQRAGMRLARLERILLTHLHGDHCLGLVGTLASMAINGRTEAVELVGPCGVRELVGTVLRLTETILAFPLHITELAAGAPVLLGQRDQGHLWQVEAYPLVHRVPCFGYVLREGPRPGRFHPERAAALGVPAGPAFGQLVQGLTVRLASGQEVRPEQVLSPARPGRVVALLGDTEDASVLVGAAQGCDLLVCETTYDASRSDKARAWGHSSTAMTGELARRLQARVLVITHFSARYTDAVPEPGRAPGAADGVAGAGADRALTVEDLLAETRLACPGTRVLAAADLWSIDIPPPDEAAVQDAASA